MWISLSVVYGYEEKDQKRVIEAKADRYHAGRLIDHGGHVFSGYPDSVVFL